MSTRKKPANFIQRLFRTIWRFFNAITKAFISWLLRSLLLRQRRSRLNQAGFVLPTVIMVILVVILLTTAIMIRSFDRSKNASNYRVNETVLNAASPALDRARAKLEYLFSPNETNLKGNTPNETDIGQAFEKPKYTFGDETPLKVVYDSNGDGKIEPEDPTNPLIPSPEKLKTAWKFPVDTDNNGKFDSFTIYGIYYRTPDTDRSRAPLEARARPQLTGAQNECTAGNGGGGAADESNGWYDVGNGQLKKAFFTYVATVPITTPPTAPYKGNVPVAQFETYKGNKGFSALEMQQDQARLSLDNNAVWYEDDLIITEVPQEGFRLNGRVQVNGNLMLGSSGNFTGPIIFYQVSSPWSCFYNAENGRIVVGGNVSANGIAGNINTTNLGNSNVQVHLFKEPRKDFNPGDGGNTEFVNDENVTTTQPPREVAYNTGAYAQRLNVLVQGGLREYDSVNSGVAPTPGAVANVAKFPKDISDDFSDKYSTTLDPTGARNLLSQVLERYFKQRIRKVPYAEVPIDKPELALQVGGAAVSGNPSLGNYVFSINAGPKGTILPPKKWMEIEDPNSHSPDGYTELALQYGPGTGMQLEQVDPEKVDAVGTQKYIGDRMYVGNGLPNAWWDEKNGKYADPEAKQDVYNGGNQVTWTDGGAGDVRKRTSQTKILDDLGDTSRNGFWEKAAADPDNLPEDKELAGGLRVVTGAGIYIDGNRPALGGTGERVSLDDILSKALINPLQKPASFLPTPPVTPAQLKAVNADIQPNNPLKPVSVVWPDLMPMYYWKDSSFGGDGIPQPKEVLKGDLQMRATVVYHYNSPTPDEPIACISSYYDPTNPDTAKNAKTIDPTNGDDKGASNNGINYQRPTAADRVVTPRLRRQAYMVFPDGRWVNKPLQDAIEALQAGKDLSLEQKAAMDAANCALRILDGASPLPGPVPDGAIRERAFLDARQVKTLHKPDYVFNPDGLTFSTTPTTNEITRQTFLKDAATGKVLVADPEQMKSATQYTLNKSTKPLSEYSLPIEQRQPLEIRVTEIDVEKLRTETYGPAKNGTPEYLLPLSGIVYASRDDALPDITDVNTSAKLAQLRIDRGGSATDFKLDPSRRPNGIRLISSDPNGGGRLSRGTTNAYTAEEKGLILASNLPVYIKGDFNRHYQFNTTTPTEEFNDTLDANYGNFYDRGKGQALPFNRQFACRPGGKKGCNVGDQWRAARILSDAITLLSNSFRDGFRSEGDYDLNNNGGNSLVAARLKNGFWWNGFATNYLYKNAGGAVQLFPNTAEFAEQDEKKLKQGSSYVMNGATPIQRRETFPQYLMEACTKLPVSECSPQDWFVGGLNNNNLRKASAIIGQNLPSNNRSGTTSQSPTGIFQSAARRVAFSRDAEFGQLILPDSCTANLGNPNNANCDAIPLGIDGTGKPAEYGYTQVGGSTAAVPPEADNALWYWTTGDSTNADPSTDPPSYGKDNLLYYLPDDPETVSTERQMLLPGIPKFPFDPNDASNPYNKNPFNYQQVGILNGISTDDPSDYSVCIRGSSSKSYKLSSFTTPACPPGTLNRISQMWTALLDPAIVTNATYSTTVSPLVVPTTPTPVDVNASSKVNFFDLSSNTLTGLTLNFKRNGQSDPIFVIRGAAVFAPMTFTDVTVRLNGVDPNNIFWVSRRGMVIDASSSTSSQLVGNFIGGNGRLRINQGSAIKGGRFLGFNPPGALVNSLTNEMTALTTTAEPLLVPVLQLHSPQGAPGDAGTAFRRSTQAPDRKWLQKATATNYNAALVMGDTPARPFPSGGGENNGGLHNFPRFIENWAGQDATIRGSLIQYIKSKYATGPFDAVDLVNQDNSLFFDGAVPAYINAQPPNDANPRGYQYFEAAALSKAPYYQPPGRKWGYDVGFLSQTPDLFSRRFAIPSAGKPNEFFREVGKDDGWIQSLLCAAEKPSTPGGGGGYQWAIADPKQRPTSCQNGNPGADYTDP